MLQDKSCLATPTVFEANSSSEPTLSMLEEAKIQLIRMAMKNLNTKQEVNDIRTYSLSEEEEGNSFMNNENITKKKKPSSNLMMKDNMLETQPARLDHVLGDDMLYHILTFLDQSFLIHTFMRVSKYWYEKVLLIPMSLSLHCRINEILSKLQTIANNRYTLNFRELSFIGTLKDESADIIRVISRSNKFNNIKSLYLKNFIFGKEEISEIASGYCKSLTTLHINSWFNTKNIDASFATIIANSDNMKELRTLRLLTDFGDDIIRELCNSDKIKNLKHLDLNGSKVSSNGIIMLSNGVSMSNLTVLKLIDIMFGEEGLSAFVNSTVLHNLQNLNLLLCSIGTTGARLLSNSPHLTQITTLALESNSIADEGVLALCESACMRNVTDLDLSDNDVTEKAVSYLTSNTSSMKCLTRLNLDWNSIEVQGAKLIATSQTMQYLKNISMCGCGIGDEGIHAICTSDYMKNLTSLNLDENNISTTGIAYLVSSTFRSCLQHLSLECNSIGVEGARLLTTSSLKLKSLILTSCDIESNGILLIANCPTFQLTELSICCNGITDEGMYAICNSPYLRKLTKLSVYDRVITMTSCFLVQI
ncbi:hypothetical protein C9374_013209 [Naegleria lovaniensis]|uniref:F-box domain-containing protein n=1 Tax=Naegleria lovaniensis TaxID=51637 RepID=A0AA88KHE0_NAELO|nr:uncharacterized protein C9374_013209 [Naegleria lovaniensis]KAG2372757.1 hypothetical protein C9374_013209 [Naegleria lovaniensis]